MAEYINGCHWMHLVISPLLFVELPSLKLTAKAHENRPLEKEIPIGKTTIF